MKHNTFQNMAINQIDGPVLIVAGPGTGKTYTLVERVVNMVSNRGIDPSEIMVTTFTNKASLELLDRLSQKFSELEIVKDVNDMLLGNFHKVASQILDEYIEFTPLRSGYTKIDDFAESYIIYRYMPNFRKIPGYFDVIEGRNEVREIMKIIGKVCEEGIVERSSENPKYNTMLKIVEYYEELLQRYNMIDFSHILFYTYKLLLENDWIRDELRGKINYIMVDEYQDTNRVQEKIIFQLLNSKNNICVVGDDDQALYRFRGATVRNILDFEKNFEKTTVINLSQNYRSEVSIVEFYQNYIREKIDNNPELKEYRRNKILFSDRLADESRVLKITGYSIEDWADKITKTILELKNKGKINSFNEVAILSSSLTHPNIEKLVSHLKKQEFGVYIPKTSNLLKRDEIKRLIGALYAIFRDIVEKAKFSKNPNVREYLENRYEMFYKIMIKDVELSGFIERMKKYVSSENVNLNIYDIVYRLLAYKPFFGYMKKENSAKRISSFIGVLKSFEIIERIYNINSENIEIFSINFFYLFLNHLESQKISEFEEEPKIPEDNQISVMTIHASKGMEYPVVIMASLWDYFYDVNRISKIDSELKELISNYSNKIDDENITYHNRLDFYRKNYTAFSRAKELLIFAGIDVRDNISKNFRDIFENVDNLIIDNLNIAPYEKKDNKIKSKYSFTTDISVYDKSPLKYYYNTKLKFYEPSTSSLFYGRIVHESIEHINKKIISRSDIPDIKDVVLQQFQQKKLEGYVFSKENIIKAISEVESYVNDIPNIGKIENSELSITVSENGYILHGNVDLIFEKYGRKHILDFKTGKPPKSNDDEKLKVYFEQINLYAHLYYLTKKEEIDTVNLYFTDESASPKIYSFKIDRDINEKLLKKIEKIIDGIENENFVDESREFNGKYIDIFLNKLISENN